jgi:hypothetical protein
MEIPPDLEGKLERQWAARVFRTTHRLKGSTQDPARQKKIPAGVTCQREPRHQW